MTVHEKKKKKKKKTKRRERKMDRIKNWKEKQSKNPEHRSIWKHEGRSCVFVRINLGSFEGSSFSEFYYWSRCCPSFLRPVSTNCPRVDSHSVPLLQLLDLIGSQSKSDHADTVLCILYRIPTEK